MWALLFGVLSDSQAQQAMQFLEHRMQTPFERQQRISRQPEYTQYISPGSSLRSSNRDSDRATVPVP